MLGLVVFARGRQVVVTIGLLVVAGLLLTGESPSELLFGKQPPALSLVTEGQAAASAAVAGAAAPDPRYQMQATGAPAISAAEAVATGAWSMS